MTYLNDHLQPGETVLHTARMSASAFLSPLFFVFLALVSVIVSVEEAAIKTENAAALAVVFFCLAALIFAWAVLAAILAAARIFTTVLAVTDRRLFGRAGLLRRRSIDLSLEELESVEARQNFFGRLFKSGTLSVRGAAGRRWDFKNTADPIKARESIEAAAGRAFSKSP